MALEQYFVRRFVQFLEFVELKHLVSDRPHIELLKSRLHLILRQILSFALSLRFFIKFSHFLSEFPISLMANARKNLFNYLEVKVCVYFRRNFKLEIWLLSLLEVVGGK